MVWNSCPTTGTSGASWKMISGIIFRPHMGQKPLRAFAVTRDEASMPIKNERLYVFENNLVYGKYWGEIFIVTLRSIPSLFAMPLVLGQVDLTLDLRLVSTVISVEPLLLGLLGEHLPDEV